MTILPKEGPMYCVEKYMTDHQFLEADKKKARDYLRIQRYDRAYLTRTDLHYFDGDLHGIVPRSMLGLQDNFV